MNKTIVISIDALISSDIEAMKRMPNLGRIMERASYVTDIECIYPTFTYPCHVTIATGVYPDKHGICHNERFQLNVPRAEWYWFAKDIQVPTVVTVAKEHGLTASTVTWPVMCDCGADYNIGEIWAPREEDDPTPYFDQADSPAVKHIYERHKDMLRWMKTPPLDNFAAVCAADIIDEFEPDLMLLHLSYVDHLRHQLGVNNPEVMKGLAFVDEKIGQVIDKVIEKGLFDRTNFVILGDHGQLYCKHIFNLNYLLQKRGYITTDENGNVTDYQIYSHSSAFSTQIYTKAGMDLDQVYAVLKEIQREYPEYIETVYTKKDVKELFHLDGPFDFVLEGQEGITFGKGLGNGELVNHVTNDDYKWSTSTHGHDPRKGDKPPFIMSGPDVKEGVVIQGGRLVDEAPTIMKLFGITMENVDGTPFDSLLKKGGQL